MLGGGGGGGASGASSGGGRGGGGAGGHAVCGEDGDELGLGHVEAERLHGDLELVVVDALVAVEIKEAELIDIYIYIICKYKKKKKVKKKTKKSLYFCFWRKNFFTKRRKKIKIKKPKKINPKKIKQNRKNRAKKLGGNGGERIIVYIYMYVCIYRFYISYSFVDFFALLFRQLG